MTDLSNSEIARRGYEAAQRGDLDALRDFLDPDVTWHGGDATAPGACRNRDQALAVMVRARSERPLPELVEVREAGDKVVVIMRRLAAGTERPELVANLTTLRDGRAVEIVHYPEVEDALRAAGL